MGHKAAIGAQQLAAIAPAVEKEDALLATRQIFTQLLVQRLANGGHVSLPQLLPHVRHNHTGQLLAVIPLAQQRQVIVAVPGVPRCFNGRRGGAQHQMAALRSAAVAGNVSGVVAGSALGFIRAFLLLVHNDQPQIFQRREHGAAGAQHDTGLPLPDALPLVIALRGPKAAVQQGYLFPKISGEAGHHLRRQGNFRHKDHHRLSQCQQLLCQADIDQRLAASGNALQQRYATGSCHDPLQDCVIRLLLLLVQCNGFCLYTIVFFSDSIGFLCAQLDHAALFQRCDGLSGRTGKIAQLMYGGLALL